MSRHAVGRELKHIFASVGATIILGGLAAAPVFFLPVGSPAAASAVSMPAASPGENNWG